MSKQIKNIATLEEVNWSEARPAFFKVKPQLAELIDERKPSKQHTFIRVRYPYGAFILKDGVLHLPNGNGQVVPIDHHTISPSIRNKLVYSSFPLGLMTHNGIEVFRESAGRVFTLRFFLRI